MAGSIVNWTHRSNRGNASLKQIDGWTQLHRHRLTVGCQTVKGAVMSMLNTIVCRCTLFLKKNHVEPLYWNRGSLLRSLVCLYFNCAKGRAASWLARSGSVAPQQILNSILIRSEFPTIGVKKPYRCARREAWPSRAWARVRGFSLPG